MADKREIPKDHTEWLARQTYYDLVRHLAAAGPLNVFHLGDTGRAFSNRMNTLRADLTPEQVAEIHQKAVIGIEPWTGTKH